MKNLSDKLALFRGDLPLARAETIPSLWYFDEEIYNAECTHVFGNTWQVVARLDQLTEPGNYVTTHIANEPIVVVRDDQGTLRAFYNVCKHRAARVMTEPCGHANKLRCNYHGWTYDLQGALRGVPEFDGVENFDRAEQGLQSLHVATWGPYVFANGADNPQPLEQVLASLPQQSQELQIDQLVFFERREYIVECNWKIYIDNFQDGGYHVNSVHPTLASAVDYQNYRTDIFSDATVQVSPFKPSADASINRLRSGDAAYYWWFFPNFIVNLYSGVMDTNLVLPLGPNRCQVIFDFFYPPITSGKQEKSIRESIAISDLVQKEDIAICEEVQRGIRSRAFQTGRYSVKREEPVYHFHKLLANHLTNGVTLPKS